MRHAPLATDAGVILPTHNYTHQQHLFCMDDSQLQIQIPPPHADSLTRALPAPPMYLPARSGTKPAHFHWTHLSPVSSFFFILFSDTAQSNEHYCYSACFRSSLFSFLYTFFFLPLIATLLSRAPRQAIYQNIRLDLTRSGFTFLDRIQIFCDASRNFSSQTNGTR